MDHVPVSFIEDLLKDLTILNDATEYTRLPKNYGKCAKQVKEKGHYKTLVIQNGNFDSFYYTNDEHNEIDTKTRTLTPKFRVHKYVEFIDDDEEPLPKSDNLTNILDEFLKEPGMLGLHVDGNSFNSKWAKICSAWESLRQVSISSDFTDSVWQLLHNLLKQEQLICLGLSEDYDGSEEVAFLGAFLQQKQFRNLRLSAWNEEVMNQLMLLTYRNKEKNLGKTITWYCKATLHDDSFECKERIGEGCISYRNGVVIANYYNDVATLETSVEKFMEDVDQCEIVFV
ncbi:hypothetical protein L596_017492 [Steinernema carpocapsae]|uniref:F-box associated domain-containing protein n=1 Tax=Steinernema carpocapsae TaxID=34508 RepID=A0A4U5N1U5_STECR|nr:hypothetical protein L596_017492 [Steinernema carpocapsae]